MQQDTQFIFCRDIEDVAIQGAELFVDRAQAAVAARGRFTVALSGCATPAVLNARLASSDVSARVPWSKVHIFWTDEVYAPAHTRATRYQRVDDALLSRVPIPGKNIYPLPTGLVDSTRAAIEYEQTLRAFFELEDGELPQFDLVLLELGSDGHAASLFPGSSAVVETARLVVPTYIHHLGEHRITMTAPVISNAAAVAFLVAGESGARLLQETLRGAYQPERWPSQLIRPTAGRLYYFVEGRAGTDLRQAGT